MALVGDGDTVAELFIVVTKKKTTLVWLVKLAETPSSERGVYVRDLLADGVVSRLEIRWPNDGSRGGVRSRLSQKAIKRDRASSRRTRGHKQIDNRANHEWAELTETTLIPE